MMFPESLPLVVIKNLFILEDSDAKLPNWTYHTMYLAFDEDSSQIKVYFISTDEQNQASFVIESTRAVMNLRSAITQEDHLIPYFLVEELSPRIYLPEEQPSVQSRTLAIERITPSKL